MLGLGATLALGLAANYLLPSTKEFDSRPAKPPSASPAQTGPTPASRAIAPWDDPALLEARAAAKTLQKEIEKQLAQLLRQGVERWAQDRLIRARTEAAAADTAFASGDFATAHHRYASASAALEALQSEIPAKLSEALASAHTALAASDKSRAQAAFEMALVLDPGNALARRGLERVASLDAVKVKLQTAARLEQGGDEAGAEAAYRAALQLDADAEQAQQGLARIAQDRLDAEFRLAMGEAIEALDRGDLATAGSRVARAQSLRPQGAGVQQAAGRLAEARRENHLAQLQREALAQTAAEDWAGAVKTYRAAQDVDATVAFARDGLARAEPRAQLAVRLQDLIDRPDRLNSLAVAEEAETLLVLARATSDRGPRLEEQITALSGALAQAAQPVSLRLRSDNLTEVTVYRVGPLGRFATRELALKPGRYVAVGTRPGYRDVRLEFEVGSSHTNPVVDVRCEETL